MTMSRHKIVKSDFLPFSHGSGVDSVAYKGLQYCRIIFEKRYPLNLFNVHLQAHYNPNDRKNIRSRLNQIAELRKGIELFLNTYTNIESSPNFDEPIYLIGDFNVCANKHLFEKDNYLKRTKTNEHFFDFVEQIDPAKKTFSEYDYLIYMLRLPFSFNGQPNTVKDFLREKYGFHPVTYVNTIHDTRDPTTLTGIHDEDSMDFVFQIIPSGQDPTRLDVMGSSDKCSMQSFPAFNKPFKFMSDHCGADFQLSLRKTSLLSKEMMTPKEKL